MKLLIAIPAFNEEKMIGEVIKNIPSRIPHVNKRDILVINDGSSDSTADIARSYKARVVEHLINRGLGASLKTALEYALNNKYDALITIDADGQHETKSIPVLVKKMIKEKADIVVGSRWLTRGNAPLIRIIINKLANLLTFFFYGIHTSDSQSGYRLFGPKALKLLKLQSEGMEVSSEIFREIARNRLEYAEIPIKVIYTRYSQSKGQKISNAPLIIWHLFMRLFK